MANILIVEDNPEIRNNLVDYLESKGHTTDNADDGLRALGLVQVNQYDLLILDVMIPGIDGFELCERIRGGKSRVPVIFLSAKDTVDDRITGLSKGADDYLVKPFSLQELNLRIEAVLRRTNPPSADKLRFADLELDLRLKSVERAGQRIALNPTAFKILCILMRNAPSLVERRTLEREIWGHTPPNTDSLRTHMHYLRSAVDKPFEKKLIKTRAGYGWYISEQ